MIHFFINRPIAVLVSFSGILISGFFCAFQLPISLLPNISIPEITIHIDGRNNSAREIENSIVNPLRNELLQVSHIKDIESRSRNGTALIKLSFEFGTDVNYAFLEANERIDAAMRILPLNTLRPKVVKSSVSDLPVITLNVMEADSKKNDFLALSTFCQSVLKRRIEQLKEVSLVDMTGVENGEVIIIPNLNLMQSIGLSENNLSQALQKANINMGNILINDGQYQYNVKFSSSLKTVSDIEKIYINSNGRLIRLSDIAQISIVPQKTKGVYLYNQKPAIAMAIIKQSDARIDDLKSNLNTILKEFKSNYPNLQFEFSQNQTAILDASVANLQSDLFFAGLFAFAVMFIFFKNYRYPLIIGISIPSALIISMLFFYIANISINIISLAGLVMGMGMIVDNSIIVIDNISQHRYKGLEVSEASSKGTIEIIRPMLSGVLTNCAVFFPLIFLGGLASTLFYDQAIAITIGLISSFLVSVIIIPVIYNLLCKNDTSYLLANAQKGKVENLLEIGYEKVLHFAFRHKKLILPGLPAILLTLSVFLFVNLEINKMPKTRSTEVLYHIDWNSPISCLENISRTKLLLHTLTGHYEVANSYIGEKQFLLENEIAQEISETEMYFNCSSYDSLLYFENIFAYNLNALFPNAIVEKKNSKSIFEQLFDKNDKMLVVHLRANENVLSAEKVFDYQKILKKNHIDCPLPPIEENISIYLLHEKLLLYEVSQEDVYQSLKSAFNENIVSELKDDQKYLPIVIGSNSQTFNDIIYRLSITNKNGQVVQLKNLIRIEKLKDFKTIYADKQGENIPLFFDVSFKTSQEIHKKIGKLLSNESNLQIDYSGGMFSSIKMFDNLGTILLISFLLLYFILAAQFESLTQPIIVLLEIPLDIFGSLLMLYLFKDSINIMSGIGIIVMSGIVINDSILKIDAINQIRTGNVPLMAAILEGGHKRLKSIVMTTLTTLLGFSSVLISGGLGSELQRPLALTLIGGLVVGTLVSLFYIPLIYWWLYKKKS